MTSPTSTTPRRRGRTALAVLTAASIAVLGLVALGATPAAAAASCPDGYSLNGGSCEKYERTDPTPQYGECVAPETNSGATTCELVVADSWTDPVGPSNVNVPDVCPAGKEPYGDACYTFNFRATPPWTDPVPFEQQGYTEYFCAAPAVEVSGSGSGPNLRCHTLIPGSTTYPERPFEYACPSGWTGPLEGEPSYCERTLVTAPGNTTGDTTTGTFVASETARGSVDFCLADGTTTLVVDYTGTGNGTSTASQADAGYAAITAAMAAAEAARADKTPAGARLGACGAPTVVPDAPVIVPASATVTNVSAPAAATVAVPAAATVPTAVPAGDGSQAPGLPLWAFALLTAGIVGTAVAGSRFMGDRQ